jgi:ABC-2 type transport system permease protein
LKFAVGLQYKTAAIAGLATQIFFGLVFISVYMAFYKSGDEITEISLSQVITYMWLGQALFAMISLWHRDPEIMKMIKNGDIAYEMCRPQNLYIMWFTRIFSAKLSAVVLRSIPLLAFAFLIPEPYNLQLPVSLFAFIMFFITLIIASVLVTSLSTLLYIISFYSLDNQGIRGIYCSIGEILSGQVVPLPLTPNFLRIISTVLPFAYVSDFSFRIYCGNIVGQELINGLIIQIIWLILSILIGVVLTNGILKRVSVQGG